MCFCLSTSRPLLTISAFLLLTCQSYSSPILRDDPSAIMIPTDKPLIAFEPSETQIVRKRPTKDVILKCSVFNVHTKNRLSWWYGGELHGELIGSLTIGKTPVVVMNWTRHNSYTILENDGGLLLMNARRELVERYECVSEERGERKSDLIYFRLDYSHWFKGPFSLFFGSCLSAIIICIASFIFNIIWIVLRKFILWWIHRAERMSRVRAMVEAMEKYRHKQMENLHETYNRRVNTIRSNYQTQVEQIRTSYSNQSDRIHGRIHAATENVTSHLTQMQENYNQQMNRMREYGSRRAEVLWESYERQLNRMRTFTLQQRLKLMRQYKVKQRYINKLLESLATTDLDTISKQEAAIRAVLDEHDAMLQRDVPNFPDRKISRSASYYSLPEFVIEEDPMDQQQLKPSAPLRPIINNAPASSNVGRVVVNLRSKDGEKELVPSGSGTQSQRLSNQEF